MDISLAKNRNSVLGLAIGVLLQAMAIAQIPNDYQYDSYKERFPKESFIKLDVLTIDQFDFDKNGLVVTTNYSDRIMCLDENATNLKKRSTGYDSFYPITDIEAVLYYPKDGKYRSEKAKTFIDEAIVDDGMSFHDSYREKSFTFENVRKGSVIWLNTKNKAVDEHLIPSRRFERNIYTGSKIYKIKCHKDIQLGIFTANMEGAGIKATEWIDGDYRYYQWELNDADKIVLFGNQAYDEYYWPQIIPYIQSYSFNGKEVEVFKTTDDLYDWYRELVARVKKSENQELAQLAHSITDTLGTEPEKVEAIYQWVQANVKYIAFSDGYGGFVPRDPDYIYQRRFGDCKDMSCLIINLLDEIDVTAHFTWIGTRHIPFKYTELPSPAVDNHMIVTYFDDEGKPYILDATDSNLKFGRAAYSVQGKQALVGITDTSYSILTIPIIPASENSEREELTVRLNGTTIEGHGKVRSSGYRAEYIHGYYADRPNERRKKDFLQSFLEKGSNKFSLGEYTYQWSDRTKDSLKIDYDFKIDSYVNQVGDNVYVNLNLSKDLKNLKLPETRNMSTFFEFLFHLEKEFLFEIPEHAEVTFLPSNAQFDNDFISYNISYEQVGQRLFYRLTFEQKVIELSAKDKDAWNKSINALSADLDRSITLRIPKTNE